MRERFRPHATVIHVARRSRWQTRHAEEEEKKPKQKKSNTKDTSTAKGVARATAEDISVSLGDTCIVDGAFTIYLPSQMSGVWRKSMTLVCIYLWIISI